MILLTDFLSMFYVQKSTKIFTSFWVFLGTNNSWTVKIKVEVKKLKWSSCLHNSLHHHLHHHHHHHKLIESP